MTHRQNNNVEEVFSLVDGIHAGLVRMEAKTGHSTEMAQIKRMRKDVERLRQLLRSQSSQGKRQMDWKKYFPYLTELALYIAKRA